MTQATASKRANAYSPYVKIACAGCGWRTHTIPGGMHWVDGMGIIKRRCLRCQRVGWYLRQMDGGAFVVWKWPAQPQHIGPSMACGFDGCPFQRGRGNRYCYGHDKQKDRYGVARMKPLNMDVVRRNRLAARKRAAR